MGVGEGGETQRKQRGELRPGYIGRPDPPRLVGLFGFSSGLVSSRFVFFRDPSCPSHCSPVTLRSLLLTLVHDLFSPSSRESNTGHCGKASLLLHHSLLVSDSSSGFGFPSRLPDVWKSQSPSLVRRRSRPWFRTASWHRSPSPSAPNYDTSPSSSAPVFVVLRRNFEIAITSTPRPITPKATLPAPPRHPRNNKRPLKDKAALIEK